MYCPAHASNVIHSLYAFKCITAAASKNAIYSGHLRLCQQPRAAHALRSDQCNLIDKVDGQRVLQIESDVLVAVSEVLF